VSGLRVAVIGSGPAGVYAAAALSRAGDVEVDVLDRLPAPYGLVRYGVAPDHVKMKSVDVALRRILEDPAVRFLGNVEVGADITRDELMTYYDAVVFATGAAVDRRLGVPARTCRAASPPPSSSPGTPGIRTRSSTCSPCRPRTPW
jgi:ferredoxin--NADP+ reductase